MLWKKQISSKENFIYWGILCLIGAMFYAVNVMTPYFSDDWHYGFMIGEERNIENVMDVLKSNWIHYFESNGRVTCHVVLMFIDGLLGKGFFNIFNAILFVCYLHLLSLNFSEKQNRLKAVCISAFLTIVVMCGFKDTFLWMSGVMNYEMVAVLVLSFNYLFNKQIASKMVLPLLFLLGLITGMSNEAVIVGYCIGLFCTNVTKLKSMALSQWCLTVGLGIGAMICVFSPGSLHRANVADGVNHFSIVGFIVSWLSSLLHMSNLRLFWLMLIMTFLFKKTNKLWLIASLSAFVFVSLTGFHNGNSRFGIELSSLALILMIIPFDKITPKITIVILGLLVGYIALCFPWCYKNICDFRSVENQIINSRESIITTNEVKCPIWAERIIQSFSFSENSEYYGCYNCKSWENTNIARYYSAGRELTFLPKVFVEDVIEGKVDEKCKVNVSYPFYACKYKSENPVKKVEFNLRKSKLVNLPIFNRMAQFTATTVSASKYCLIDINGETYLIVPRNYNIDDRVESIVIE